MIIGMIGWILNITADKVELIILILNNGPSLMLLMHLDQ